MKTIAEQLKRGVRRFRTEIYPKGAEGFLRAANQPQTPHTLIITCADSRIDPKLITDSETGDVFVARNIGNMVPPYGEMLGGVSAVIEYAISALKVRHVVVCGHSDCGGIKALINPELVKEMPTVRSWLNNATAALSVAQSLAPPDESPADFLDRLTKENVLMQMQHLRTHPSVAGAMARGQLTIAGWIYNIGTGCVYATKGESREFEEIGIDEAKSDDEIPIVTA